MKIVGVDQSVIVVVGCDGGSDDEDGWDDGNGDVDDGRVIMSRSFDEKPF